MSDATFGLSYEAGAVAEAGLDCRYRYPPFSTGRAVIKWHCYPTYRRGPPVDSLPRCSARSPSLHSARSNSRDRTDGMSRPWDKSTVSRLISRDGGKLQTSSNVRHGDVVNTRGINRRVCRNSREDVKIARDVPRGSLEPVVQVDVSIRREAVVRSVPPFVLDFSSKSSLSSNNQKSKELRDRIWTTNILNYPKIGKNRSIEEINLCKFL